MARAVLARQDLSSRECEILGLVVNGLTNRQIAHRLGISPRTVQSHVASAARKTLTRTRVQLAVYAVCGGITPCPKARQSADHEAWPCYAMVMADAGPNMPGQAGGRGSGIRKMAD